MQRLEEKSSVSVGDRTPFVQPVVRHVKERDTVYLSRPTEGIRRYTKKGQRKAD
jgi:hypothetical protein